MVHLTVLWANVLGKSIATSLHPRQPHKKSLMIVVASVSNCNKGLEYQSKGRQAF